MACPLCFTAAVMGTSHTQSPFSPPGPTNMQDGNWTQMFHQGPLLVCLTMGLGPIRVFARGGGSVQEDTLCFPHTQRRPAVTAAEKKRVLSPSRSPLLHPSYSLSYLHIIRRERRPETRTWLTVFSVTMMASFTCAQPFQNSLVLQIPSHHMNAICRRLP